MPVYDGTEAGVAEALDLEYSNDGGTTWVKVPEVLSGDPPKSEVETKDATNFDSGGWKEKLLGFRDGGNIDVKSHYIKSVFLALHALKGVKLDWRMTFEDGLRFEFDAFADVLPDGVNPGDVRTMTTSLEISGEPVVVDSAVA